MRFALRPQSTFRGLVAFAVVVALCSALPARSETFAIIVGNNTSLDPSDKTLRFADDDAARYHELFTRFGARAQLLAVLDSETQRLFPDAAAVARAPTRQNLRAALAEANHAIERAGNDGRASTFVFVFVGHGSVRGGMGYVSLLDERFTRADLFREVVAPSRAAFNHLVIDACDSYFMVSSRGGEPTPDERGPDYSANIKQYVLEEDLSRYPNTGVLVSTSKRQESHEWEGFRAGVFSHELRSALLGGADVNRDGQIEYSEIGAFIHAANVSLEDPRARTDVFARAPALDVHRPLVDMSAGGRQFIEVGKDVAGHFFLEDARGVRVGDFNKGEGASLILAPPPSAYYFLRGSEHEAKVALDGDGTTVVSRRAFRPLSMASRGSLSEELSQKLFAVPYGRSFYDGFVSQQQGVAVRSPRVPFPPSELSFPPGVVSNLADNPY